MIELSEDSPLADVAMMPGAVALLWHLDLDFAFQGERPLDAACAERGLAVEEVMQALFAQTAQSEDPGWDQLPPKTLVALIVERLHRPLPGRLAALREAAGRQNLRGLHLLLRQLEGWTTSHLAKEEAGLFPAILSGRPTEAAEAIVHSEHADQARMLGRLRELTGRFTPPEGASQEHQALYEALAQLDAEFRLHVHLEDNVLLRRLHKG